MADQATKAYARALRKNQTEEISDLKPLTSGKRSSLQDQDPHKNHEHSHFSASLRFASPRKGLRGEDRSPAIICIGSQLE